MKHKKQLSFNDNDCNGKTTVDNDGLFFSISQDDFYAYLTRGAFFDRYIGNKLGIKLTSRMFNFFEHITVFNRYYSEIGDKILISLNLNKKEKDKIVFCNKNKNIGFLKGFIPITKIKKVYFKTAEDLNSILSMPYEEIPVPYSLCELNIDMFSDISVNEEISEVLNKKGKYDFNSYFLFDKLLGGIYLSLVPNFYFFSQNGIFEFSKNDEFFYWLKAIYKDKKSNRMIDNFVRNNVKIKNIEFKIDKDKKEIENFLRFIVKNKKNSSKTINGLLRNIILDFVDKKTSVIKLPNYKKVRAICFSKEDEIFYSNYKKNYDKWSKGKLGYNFKFVLDELCKNIPESKNVLDYWEYFAILFFKKNSCNGNDVSMNDLINIVPHFSKDKNIIFILLFLLGYFAGYSKLPGVFKIDPLSLSFEEKILIDEKYNIKPRDYLKWDELLFDSCFYLSSGKRDKKLILEEANKNENKTNISSIGENITICYVSKNNIFGKRADRVEVRHYKNAKKENNIIVVEK